MGLLVLRQFSVCKHAIACTPAGSLAFVAHGSAYSNRSPYRHDSGLPQVSGGSAPAYDFSRPPRRSQLSYGLLTRHTAERRVFLEGFDGFVTSTAAPIATGWSDLCRVGIAPTEVLHLFTTHRHPISAPRGPSDQDTHLVVSLRCEMRGQATHLPKMPEMPGQATEMPGRDARTCNASPEDARKD